MFEGGLAVLARLVLRGFWPGIDGGAGLVFRGVMVWC